MDEFQIDKDTVLCISIAGRPSNFGTTVHNAAFRHLRLNYIYKAFGVSDLRNAVAGVRAFGIRGCGVSMPFKETIIEHLDELDETARSIQAVNTVVNDNRKLTGYNTDAVGFESIVKSLCIDSNQKILLLGAGGVARAIGYVLKKIGCENVMITNRTPERAEILSQHYRFKVIPWEQRNFLKPYFLINATSIGMKPDVDAMPVNSKLLRLCNVVCDVVVTPKETKLINEARRLNKDCIPGYRMSLYQAVAQFELYTGMQAPIEIMEEAMMRIR